MKISGKQGFLLLIIMVICWSGCGQKQENQALDSQNEKIKTDPVEYWQDLVGDYSTPEQRVGAFNLERTLGNLYDDLPAVGMEAK